MLSLCKNNHTGSNENHSNQYAVSEGTCKIVLILSTLLFFCLTYALIWILSSLCVLPTSLDSWCSKYLTVVHPYGWYSAVNALGSIKDRVCSDTTLKHCAAACHWVVLIRDLYSSLGHDSLAWRQYHMKQLQKGH